MGRIIISEEKQIYEECKVNGQWLKSVEFKSPIFTLSLNKVNPIRDENATNMLSLASYLALFIFMLVSCYVMYKASGIYVPEEVGEGITDLLSELM